MYTLPTYNMLSDYKAFNAKDRTYARVWSDLSDLINREYMLLVKYGRLPLIKLVDESEPYPNVEAMRLDLCHGRMMVSDLHHEHPIFTRHTNIRFRVLHDLIHCRLNAPFTEQGEFEVYKAHVEGLDNALLCSALYTEVMIQASYRIHFGEFTTQKLFIVEDLL